jgi:hypothetical protein
MRWVDDILGAVLQLLSNFTIGEFLVAVATHSIVQLKLMPGVAAGGRNGHE